MARFPGDGSGDLVLVGPQGRSDRYHHNPDGSFTPPPAVYTTLVKNADLSYTATMPDQTTWGFDPYGRLQTEHDRYGNVSTFTYNLNRQLVAVSDPAGRGSLTLGYGTTGLLVSVTDWTGRKVQFGYDASGRLHTVTDRDSQVTTYGYDGTTSHLTTITDANGHVAVTMTYDSQGRVATQKDAMGLNTGQQTTFSYPASEPGTTTVIYPVTSFDGTQPTVADVYDGQGRLTQRISHPSASETYTVSQTYDANSNVSISTDGRGNVSTLCWDVDYSGTAIAGSHGNLTRTISPPPTAGANPLVTLFKYDGKHNLLETVAPKGVGNGSSVSCSTNLSGSVNTLYATDNTYDSNGVDLLSTTSRFTDPDLGQQTATTKYEYGDSANPGRVTRTIPPRGNTGGSPDYSYATTMAYYGSGSQAGMVQTINDPLSGHATYSYDAVGRKVSMVDPVGNTWKWAYDNEDRVTSATAPAPSGGGSPLVTQARYDAVGNLTVAIDANGQVTKNLYDVRDALSEVDQRPNPWTDPNVTPNPKYVTTYQHDNLGNLTRTTRAAGDAANERATDDTYDGLNRLRQEIQYPNWPSTSGPLTTQYAYDANGNQTSLTKPDTTTLHFTFDTLNRLLGRDNPQVAYTYDADGNRLTMVDPTGTTSYSYDELDRLLSVSSPGSGGANVVGYRYDLDGNRRTTTYPDRTSVTATYDKADRLTQLADWASRHTGYTYFADGLLQTVTNVDGTTASYSYDNARRLTQVLNQQGTNTISQHSYTLDAVGNRLQASEILPQLANVGGGSMAPAKAGAAGAPATPGPFVPSVPPRLGIRPGAAAAPVLPPPSGGRLTLPDPTAPGLPAFPLGPHPAATAPSPSTVGSATPAAPVSPAPGTPWVWGDDYSGQLGDGTTTNRSTPKQVAGQAGVTAVAGGVGATLALHGDGTVWAWGDNSYGELGTSPSPAPVLAPTQVPDLSGVTAIAAGLIHGVTLKQDGTVWTWGDNSYGELGTGSTTPATGPVQVAGLAGVVAIAAEGYHTLALKQDGTVWAWGLNAYGELGTGSASTTGCQCSPTPVQVVGISGASALAAGTYQSYVLAGGTVWAFGLDADGETGGPANGSCGGVACSPTPQQVTGAGGTGTLSGVTKLGAGGYHGLAVTQDGTVWAWGFNGDGELGDGTTTSRTSPVQAVGLTGVTAIAGGFIHSLAVKGDGTVWAWGDNEQGQLGNGSRTQADAPTQVGGLTGTAALAGGFASSLAVKADGTLWAFGDDYYGQLGDGTTTNRSTPMPLQGVSGVVQVGGEDQASVVLTSDGAVWATGDNGSGELGDGTTTQRTSAVQAAGLPAVTAIAAGGYHALALAQDGTVWAWGNNAAGQLGNGGASSTGCQCVPTPAKVPGLTGVVAIAAGYVTSYAFKADGSVWAWGYNADGETGSGSATTTGCYCLPSPIQVVGPGGTGSLAGVVGLAAGAFHALAAKNDGTVWAWGLNTYGALGDGTTTSRSSPVQASGLSAVTTVAGGGYHNLAVKSDGSVWAWGLNGNGQLGDGTTTTRLEAVQVGGVSATSAAGGDAHSLALEGDGTLVATGANGYGQLGTGNRTQASTATGVLNLGGMATLGAGGQHGLATAIRTRTTTYAYDRLYELIGVGGPGQPSTSYTYDPVGNRLSVTSGGTTTPSTYDKADRLTSVGTSSCTVDADGNLVSGCAFSNAYDAANRLISASGVVSTDYTLDGDGKRTHVDVAGNPNSHHFDYVYDVNGSLPVVLVDGNSNGSLKYVWGPAGLAYAVDTSNGVTVYHTDGLGSVRAITDGSGTVVQTYRSDAYGVPTSTQGSVNQHFQFAGQERDEDGLVFLRGRVYNPTLGRFLQRDPLGRRPRPAALAQPLQLRPEQPDHPDRPERAVQQPGDEQQPPVVVLGPHGPVPDQLPRPRPGLRLRLRRGGGNCLPCAGRVEQGSLPHWRQRDAIDHEDPTVQGFSLQAKVNGRAGAERG